MADIRDWDLYRRGRWNWQALGYENAFPRGIGFSDIDAVVEINGRFLFIEAKHYDGSGFLPNIPRGQELLLRRLSKLPGVAVFVVYGDAAENLVHAVRRFRHTPEGMFAVDFFDWRADPCAGRSDLFRLLSQFVDWSGDEAAS